MNQILYTRAQLDTMAFYGFGSADTPTVRALIDVWNGEYYIEHNAVMEAIAGYVTKLPRKGVMYSRLGGLVSCSRKDNLVAISPMFQAVADVFRQDSDHYFVRIGSATAHLGYSNVNVRRAVEREEMDGYLLVNNTMREHYLAISESEAKRLIAEADAILAICDEDIPCVEPPSTNRRKLIEEMNPKVILSLLEAEGHGETILADKIRIHLRDSVLPNHIMYDVKKVL